MNLLDLRVVSWPLRPVVFAVILAHTGRGSAVQNGASESMKDGREADFSSRVCNSSGCCYLGLEFTGTDPESDFRVLVGVIGCVSRFSRAVARRRRSRRLTELVRAKP